MTVLASKISKTYSSQSAHPSCHLVNRDKALTSTTESQYQLEMRGKA